VKKAFCLLTKNVPSSSELNKINVWLKEQALSGQLFDRFEEYIVRLLFEVPAPIILDRLKIFLPPTISSKLPTVVDINLPSVGYGLPYIDKKCINTLFQYLNLDNIILLFKRVLLDTSNLFISDERSLLVDCCEAIKSLIFPFKYEQVYIPNLPEGLRDRVDCPYIFMMGLVKQEYAKTKESIKDGTYIVDIDKDYIF